MDFSNLIKEITLSNEYVTQSNKQIESSNHGQSKLKFKSSSPFFVGFEKCDVNNKLGKNQTSDDFTYKGKICFYKKHILQFFDNIKCIYEKHSDDYKNINIQKWEKIYNKFNELYSNYKYDDLIHEELTTTNYRFHEQGLVFTLYQKILYYAAIPYACKIVFYKIKNSSEIFIIPLVDFSLLETSYFAKLKEKPYKVVHATVRKYQSRYRDQIISRDNVCVLSGIQTTSTLEAAHIKPYFKSTEKEQSDPNNGLLLSATFHRFFEIGFIGFEPQSGKLLISKYVSDDDKKWIENNTTKFISLKEFYKDHYNKLQNYVAYHYKHIYIQ